MTMPSEGILSVVGTPIGNLSDASPRVLDVLARADVILCEDTRVTGKLLSAFGIHVSMQRCDENVMLTYVSEHAKEYQTLYGNVSPASVGAIQRTLISVEDQGGDVFFGEPALDLGDWFTCAPDGRGYVNILNAAKLIQMPQIYAMSEEEALVQTDLLGHDFYVFTNATTGLVNVIYHRRHGGYGIIKPKIEEENEQ